MLRSLAVSLAFLWAVKAVESDAFGALVVQNFDSVAIEHRDDGAAEVSCERRTGEKDVQHYDQTVGIVCDASRRVTPGRKRWSRGSIELQHREPGGAFILLLPYTFVGMTSRGVVL